MQSSGSSYDKENAAAQRNEVAPAAGMASGPPDQGPAACPAGAAGHFGWQPNRAAGLTLLDVQQSPAGNMAWAPPPVSCPSRLQQHSPVRLGSGSSFDPFAAPATEEPPGCTPMCAQAAPSSQRVAPPAVHRKPAADGSPVQAAPPAVALLADRVQSCPPERAGRRGARPLVRLRVKRSLNGAVAAAAAAPPQLARRSMDLSALSAPGAAAGGAVAAAAPPLQQLAGCRRGRSEAELLSPPSMPRKTSRTLLEDQQTADLMAGLRLEAPLAAAAPPAADSSSSEPT